MLAYCRRCGAEHELFLGDVSKCLFAPDRAPATDQISQFGEPMDLLDLITFLWTIGYLPEHG